MHHVIMSFMCDASQRVRGECDNSAQPHPTRLTCSGAQRLGSCGSKVNRKAERLQTMNKCGFNLSHHTVPWLSTDGHV